MIKSWEFVENSVVFILETTATDNEICKMKYYNLDITKTVSKKLPLDLKKHNEQYSPVTIRKFADAHDRSLITNSTEIYHIGASPKDQGKKWFAFSMFEKGAI
ncbi:hypothetical protein SDC9_112579 [bioreactor metagenome]|uniref:Uncharacterized protein n=1 Tax=bioreactor metagenome TaxID=1076179 RepID=A0A645BKE7_9ZZZZ